MVGGEVEERARVEERAEKLLVGGDRVEGEDTASALDRKI